MHIDIIQLSAMIFILANTCRMDVVHELQLLNMLKYSRAETVPTSPFFKQWSKRRA